MDKVQAYWKAIVAFIAPAVPLVVAAVQQGSPGGQTITVPEWVSIGAAMVVTGGAVYVAPKNKDTTYNDTGAYESDTEELPEAGA